MHVLVTGGAGFIGSHLVGLLLKQGHEVHVVDDLSTGQRANLAEFEGDPKFRFNEADIITWDGLWPAAQWADRIFHLAAVVGVRRVLESPVHVMATNIAGTERVLRAAAASGWRPREYGMVVPNFVRQAVQVGLVVSLGALKDNTMHSFTLANSYALEATLGLLRDWEWKFRAAYTNNGSSAAGPGFSSENFGMTLIRRF